jgi:hypothetical protein
MDIEIQRESQYDCLPADDSPHHAFLHFHPLKLGLKPQVGAEKEGSTAWCAARNVSYQS